LPLEHSRAGAAAPGLSQGRLRRSGQRLSHVVHVQHHESSMIDEPRLTRVVIR
jgi:hypothetical protein